MPQLNTKYLGLNLRNPIIVASSGLSKSVDNIIECEKAGAGAVVLKSLFEEVLAQEEVGIQNSTGFHTEAYEYLRSGLALEYGPRDYCSLIYDAKKAVDIPVIASINCVTSKWWPSFASQIEGAGADALELNVFTTATDVAQTGGSLEALYYDIIETVKKKVNIPVAMKLGMYFTSLPNIGMELCRRGANGLVLFNRFTEPDIDINKLELKTTFQFSSQYELHKPLRWIALLNNKVQGDLCATTGIQKSNDVIKLLLAGANAVEIASVLYRNGLESISEMLTEIDQWMDEHKFNSISDFRGLLSFEKAGKPDHFLRAQFMEKIKGYE